MKMRDGGYQQDGQKIQQEVNQHGVRQENQMIFVISQKYFYRMMKIININGLPIGKLKKIVEQMMMDGNMPMILIVNLEKMRSLNMLEEENGLDMLIKFNLNYFYININ